MIFSLNFKCKVMLNLRLFNFKVFFFKKKDFMLFLNKFNTFLLVFLKNNEYNSFNF